MRNRRFHLRLASFCALFLALSLNSSHAEGLPSFTADGLRLSDVQAAEAQVPEAPVSAKAVFSLPDLLSRKSRAVHGWLHDHGSVCVKSGLSESNPQYLAHDPHADYSPSPAYQNWSSFYKNETKPPEDLAGEWDLVGAALFGYWPLGNCGRHGPCTACLGSIVSTNPEGMPATSFPDDDGTAPVKLKFSERTVSVGGGHMAGCGLPDSCPPYVYGYAEGAGSVDWDSSIRLLAAPTDRAHWNCRAFQGDGSKLICGVAGDGANRPWSFLVYARADGKDSLDPLGALLKPFLPTPPAQPHLTRSRPRN